MTLLQRKLKNRGDSPSVDSFSRLIPCQEHGISEHSVNPETRDSEICGRLRQS
jgi:hypothetical protein